MLGGSSNINTQIHQWCHPADFDGWAAAGAEGWGWQDVAPVLLAQENWSRPNGGTSRGPDGPMLVAPNSATQKRLTVPAETLAGLGLPVVVDAPEVGANLQDHPTVPLVFNTHRTDTLKKAESPLMLLRYLLFKRGMLATNGIEAFAFARSGFNAAAPDLEILCAPFEWRKEGLEPPQTHGFTLAPAVVAPLSRGRVRMTSPDPWQPPAIDFGLLTDPAGTDAKVLLAAIRLARKIAAQMSASDNAGELSPGPTMTAGEDLRAWCNTCIQRVYHPTSTCRMGSDSRAVVNPQLRVNGVDGLWVADASVMPAIPRGHPNAVVAMIACRAAEMVK